MTVGERLPTPRAGFEPATSPFSVVVTPSDGHFHAEQARYHVTQGALEPGSDLFKHADEIHARGWHRALDIAGVDEGTPSDARGVASGAAHMRPSGRCERCDGDGWVEVFDPEHYGAVVGAHDCPACGGSGQAADDARGCNGTGRR